MHDLLVLNVVPFGPGSESADVTLSSGQAEVVVFCYPCSHVPGDKVRNMLSALDADLSSPYFEDWPEDEKQRLSAERLERIRGFAYRGCGKVIDQQAGLIQVLGFVIDVGDVPCTGAVEFETDRLDLP